MSKLEIFKRQLEIDAKDKECELLRKNYSGTLNSASYKLGHLLLHEIKTFTDLLALPKKIYSIRRDSLEQKSRLKHSSVDATFLLNKDAKLDDKKELLDIKKLRVSCIMDTFTYSYFSPEANFNQLTSSSWRSEIEAFRPEVLFVESAWRGKDDSWVQKVEFLSQELVDLLSYCREHNIPTLFWSKEDPTYFDNFIDTAKYFDYIFTTDIECIAKYRQHVLHKRVYLLPFGCQPKIHNPIQRSLRKHGVVFAGAYYHRYKRRTATLESFMSTLIPLIDIDIYDREFYNSDSVHKFPSAYKPFIRGNLSYKDIDIANKGYEYAINLNSITDSSSMFARRVFELLACNTTVLSNYSKGVERLFGELVVTTDDADLMLERFASLEKDDLKKRKLRLLALRKVMMEHTAKDRLHSAISKIYNIKSVTKSYLVLVVGYATSKDEALMLYDLFASQTYANKQLVVVTDCADVIKMDLGSALCVGLSESKSINDLGLDIEFDYVAGMVFEDYYAPNYLLDLMLATEYGDFNLIGKSSHYEYLDGKVVLHHQQHRYCEVDSLLARASIIKIDKLPMQNIALLAQKLLTLKFEDSSSLSIDEFNYCKSLNSTEIESRFIEIVCDLDSVDVGVSLEALTHA